MSNADTTYVDHSLIADETLESREYQNYLSQAAETDSTLVVLPTGLGKTAVSLRITAKRLKEKGGGTSLLLAPTKPLVEQHAETYRELLDIAEDEIVIFTGETRPEKREEIWNTGKSVIIATPQVIQNDLLSNRISLEDVIHLTFDECHRATGEYPYSYIAEKYIEQCAEPVITGLSASPGDTEEDVLQVCKNIHVNGIEVLTEDDERVAPYSHETEVEPRFIDIDDRILAIRDKIQEVYKDRLKDLKSDGYIDSARKDLPVGALQSARGKIQQGMNKGDSDAYQAMSLWAESMKLAQAVEQIETQGVDAFVEYASRLETEIQSDDSSKAVERLLADPKFQQALEDAKDYDDTYDKFEALRAELVREVKLNDGKSLVFTKSRDTVELLLEILDDTFDVSRLVGQQDKENSDGMTQNEQRDAIKKFETGETEVLISTQVGEEGLDIPSVDLVVFYEPVTKGIELIQRQGRTGRNQKGRVVILIGEGTRDVGYYYKAKNQQDSMEDDMEELQQVDNLAEEINEKLEEENKQKTLSEISQQSENKNAEVDTETPSPSDQNSEPTETPEIEHSDDDSVTIIADQRETKSSVTRELDTTDGVNLRLEQLDVGDYIVGNNCAVERKSIEDFHDTLTGDRSLFEQVGNIADSYANGILLLEGDQKSLYNANIHENAIRGALSSIVTDFGLSTMHSIDEEDTAKTLVSLAKRKQEDTETTVNPHGNKQTSSVPDQQEYIVSSIDTVGPQTAESLLTEFDTVTNIFNATVDELQEVDGIGTETAKKIFSITRTEYNPSRR